MYLLGATGYVGAFLLDEILRNNTSLSIIYVLVKATNHQLATQKLEQALNKLGIKIDDWAKIKVICGDLGKSKFGLEEIEFNSMANNIGNKI